LIDDVQVDSGTICAEGELIPCPLINAGAGATVAVVDSTPIITGIDPSVWNASATSSTTTPNVVFSGQNFGTNTPFLTFSPSSGIGYTLISNSDSQITANITVAAGTPNEDVSVMATNNGYGGNAFNGASAGESATSSWANATVHAPMNSSEVTVIGWIDPTQITLPPGANNSLTVALNASSATCGAEELLWSLGGTGSVYSSADAAYANAWLLKFGANSPPPSSITPSIQSALRATYRLYNDFGNSSSTAQVGWTPDPCGLIPIPAPGQPHPSNGNVGLNTITGNTYQLAEGRVGSIGQKIYATLNNNQTVPYIWSVVEFNASGTSVNITNSANYQIFPTYYVYVNKVLQTSYTRVQTSVSTITQPIYQNSQLLPPAIQ
jgi:hypothetical protein